MQSAFCLLSFTDEGNLMLIFMFSLELQFAKFERYFNEWINKESKRVLKSSYERLIKIHM